MKLIIALLCLAMSNLASFAESKKTHYIHWNKANPMFRLDNTDHVMDVNVGNLPWEYDQVNIICPMSKAGSRYPERHVVYSVSREEYESCRITNPKPRVVAVCSQPHQLLYFTITFRSFTPTPGGLEFHPGQDYYFISTSSREDLHRRVGGGCATHNMKMIFRVADNTFDPQSNLIEFEEDFEVEITPKTTTTTKKPIQRFNSKSPYSRNEYIYYYHPRDLVQIQDNTIDNYSIYNSNEVWTENEALRYTSGSAKNTVYAGQKTAILTMVLAAAFSRLLLC